MRQQVITCDLCPEDDATAVTGPIRRTELPDGWAYVSVSIAIGGSTCNTDFYLDACDECLDDPKKLGGIHKFVKTRFHDIAEQQRVAVGVPTARREKTKRGKQTGVGRDGRT